MTPSRSSHEIEDVSDTALWVAYYRVLETERPDALFKDPLAARLVGDRGRKISENMPAHWRIDWLISTRTVMIDEFIRDALAGGVDTVLNLGAGLDTRPYRMDLPASLRWIEVDYPHMIELKNEKLQGEKPHCRLERIAQDLSQEDPRRELFARINSESGKVLVLTEGVVPYLTNEQAASLARDLREQAKFKLWIVDYMSEHAVRYLRQRPERRTLRNAPFQFKPSRYFEFFEREGWKLKDIRYSIVEAGKLGRHVPLPWWLRLVVRIAPKKRLEHVRKAMGYAVLEAL